jgi:AcrR family transcriptional regulator
MTSTIKTAQKKLAKRGRPRSGEMEIRWDDILDLATLVLLRDGYGGTSVAKIAREAGVSNKTIYAGYANKAELTAAVLKRLFERSWQRLAFLAKSEEDDVRQFLTEFAIIAAQNATSPAGTGLYRILIAESSVSKLLTGLYEEVQAYCYGPLSKVLQAAMDRGELRKVDPGLLARTFYQVAVGDLRERALLGFAISKAEIRKTAAFTVEMLLAAYSTQTQTNHENNMNRDRTRQPLAVVKAGR